MLGILLKLEHSTRLENYTEIVVHVIVMAYAHLMAGNGYYDVGHALLSMILVNRIVI